MKIIIAGVGEVGSYLAKMLSNGNHEITIIDNMYEQRLKMLDAQFDLMTVFAYPASLEILQDARIKKTDLFIAVTPYETTNITACIIAKQLGAKQTSARIDNMEYIQEENKAFFARLGVDSLIYPELLAAKEIHRLLQQAAVKKVFDFSSGKLSLLVIKLNENAPIVNKTLNEISGTKNGHEYRAVAITRNGETIIPRGTDAFRVNDLIYVITNKSGKVDVLQNTGIEPFSIKNVMILGGSRIGKKTAKELESHINVKLLEIDKEKSLKVADDLDNTLVINADGRNVNVLLEEGITNMDAFIAVTGNSETNILSCVLAKKLGVKKTIAEVENMDYITLADSMGIESVINKKLIAASHIYRFTTSAHVSVVQCLAGTDAEVLEFIVKPTAKITKKPIKDISFPRGAIIGGIVRGKSNIIAKGDCQIEPGDKVVIFSLPSAISKVAKFFK